MLFDAERDLLMLIMNDEIRWLTQQPGMARWGTAPGSVILHGQKVPVDRPRLRDQAQEAKLGSYELFRRDEEMQRRVWDKVMRGVSMRSYDPVVRYALQSENSAETKPWWSVVSNTSSGTCASPSLQSSAPTGSRS